jgi:hypothetical protein
VQAIAYGGLGVPDLERTGRLAMRLCWLWFSRTDNRRAWNDLDLQFTDDERALFFASTTMAVGNGQKSSAGAKSGLSPKGCRGTAGLRTSMASLACTRLGNT